MVVLRNRRVIISRKGFDSSSGGKPSPRFEDGSLISIPIPWGWSGVGYDDILLGPNFPGITYKDMMLDLGIRFYSECHLDPDIREEMYKRDNSWFPAFGQAGNAESELVKLDVGVEGDLFLFFGWFRKAKYDGNSFSYVKPYEDFHGIWGYLEVGKTLDLKSPSTVVPDNLKSHPHMTDSYLINSHHNRLYVPIENSTLFNHGKGYGVFKDSKATRLSAGALNSGDLLKSIWRLKDFLKPLNNRVKRLENGLYDAARSQGQEFIFEVDSQDESNLKNWLNKMTG